MASPDDVVSSAVTTSTAHLQGWAVNPAIRVGGRRSIISDTAGVPAFWAIRSIVTVSGHRVYGIGGSERGSLARQVLGGRCKCPCSTVYSSDGAEVPVILNIEEGGSGCRPAAPNRRVVEGEYDLTPTETAST